MDDLVRWLGDQLDVDAARAEAARDAEFCKDGRWLGKGPFEEGLGSVHSEASEAILGEEESVPFALADHIAAHDPARVLREIDAKRQVLAEYEQAARYAKTTWGQSNADQSRARTLGKVVRLLAAVCADRPGYREEWRP